MEAIVETKNFVSLRHQYDVIISGAGPVGLFLACELALAKCSVLVLEKAQNSYSPLKQIPFGIRGLSAPTVEALYRRGLLDELEVPKRLQNPHPHAGHLSRRQVGHFAGIPIYEGDVDTSRWESRLPSSTATSMVAEMEELETVLTRRAELLGVEIKRGFAVTGLEQNENMVMVHSGEQSFQSEWLVGCDGSRSAVRKLAGFEFAGTDPEFTGYSTLVDIADPEKLSPGRNLTANGMYLQSQPGYVIVQDFDGGAFHDARKPVTREHAQEVLRRISNTDVTLKALHIATTWTDRSRQATSYRKGRVLLAGDAAHIHSPLGGQGLNLGVGDAMNLGWKLAATLQGKAPVGLLDSYEEERYPLGTQVLDWSRAQVEIMRPEPRSRALNSIIRDLMSTRDGATYFAGRVWGIGTRYDLGSDHPLVGQSVPNFEFENGSKIGEFMHNGRGIMLDFDGRASLQTLTREYADQIIYVSGKAKQHLDVSAVLVRPDGVIAWASAVSDNDLHCNLLQKAIARWFG